MMLRKGVLQRFYHSGCRDRTRNKSNANRLKLLGGEGLAGETSPKTVTIAGYRGETSDSVIANKIVDFRPLNVSGAVISGTEASVESGVPITWPRLRYAVRQVLRVCPHLKSGYSVAPNFPSRS